MYILLGRYPSSSEYWTQGQAGAGVMPSLHHEILDKFNFLASYEDLGICGVLGNGSRCKLNHISNEPWAWAWCIFHFQ